jgi:hypothetical protein
MLFALFLTACPMEDNNENNTEQEQEEEEQITGGFADGKGEKELYYVPDGNIYFLSLSTGEIITAEAGKEQEHEAYETIESPGWDLAFYPARQIWTNSGVTAGGYFTGGNGGVWHTNQTDFDAVTGKDARIIGVDPVDNVDYSDYHEDVFRYAIGMAGSNMRPERHMNVMTYLGWSIEDNGRGKTASNYFQSDYMYNRRAFYANTFDAPGVMTMPPRFYVTNQVYIIRHGDGVHYSKFQVTKYIRYYEGTAGYADTYGFRWENLE